MILYLNAHEHEARRLRHIINQAVKKQRKPPEISNSSLARKLSKINSQLRIRNHGGQKAVGEQFKVQLLTRNSKSRKTML